MCPTPIGNMGDITLRTLEVLKSVDIIACEDTRDSAKLMKHYEINTPLTSYHDHNRISKGQYLIELLAEGKNIALISDAGMPGISDPGEDIIRECIEYGIEYTVLPGANAFATALVMSGLSTKRFAFEGFLPRKGSQRRELLAEIADEKRTVILYESPHHLLKTLEDVKEILGKRKITIVREISKIYEEIIHTTANEAPDIFKNKVPKGEFVLIIEGKSQEEILEEVREKYKDVDLADHMQIYLDQGLDRKEAMKAVAKDLGTSKREIYNRLNKG